MSDYTAVNVPPQNPERVVYPHEIVPPSKNETFKPPGLQANDNWLDVHKKVPPQAGVV